MRSREWFILSAVALVMAAPLSGCGDNDNNVVFSDCGNGTVDGNEQCDDGNSIEADECLSTCRFATCGDGFIRTGFEACGSTNLGAPPATCSSLGQGNGTSRCGNDCDFDNSDCDSGS